MSDSTWVIGKSGRPIRVGGKAHKKMLKEQRLAEAESRPTMSLNGPGARASVLEVGDPVIPMIPTLKREKTLALGTEEPAIKKKKVSKSKEKKIYDAAQLTLELQKVQKSGDKKDDMSDSDASDDSDEEEESESTLGDDSRPEGADLPSSKKEVQAIVEQFLGQHQDELCRAYEALGDGPKFVQYLNNLMEKKLI